MIIEKGLAVWPKGSCGQNRNNKMKPTAIGCRNTTRTRRLTSFRFTRLRFVNVDVYVDGNETEPGEAEVIDDDKSTL